VMQELAVVVIVVFVENDPADARLSLKDHNNQSVVGFIDDILPTCHSKG